MKVTVKADVRKMCPYVAEPDIGSVEITYDVAEGDAPELHGLAEQLSRQLGSWADQAVSHEEFTRWVAEATGAERVVSHWTTAGLDVTCDLSCESVRS